MIQAHQDTDYYAPTLMVLKSDFRGTTLQLLSAASEISYRRFVTSECPLVRQMELDKKWMFDDAMEQLTFIGRTASPYVARMVRLAAKRAYEVFCADTEERDRAFYDASYGIEGADQYHDAS